jgi:hypothetical protein
MNKVQEPRNSECYTPSSEPFRIYLTSCIANRSMPYSWVTSIKFQSATFYLKTAHSRFKCLICYVVLCISIQLQSLKPSQQLKLFMEWSFQPHALLPTRRTRVSIFVCIITFDLSSMGDPTSSYATASMALRIIWSCKPDQYVKVGIPEGGLPHDYSAFICCESFRTYKISVLLSNTKKWWKTSTSASFFIENRKSRKNDVLNFYKLEKVKEKIILIVIQNIYCGSANNDNHTPASLV